MDMLKILHSRRQISNLKISFIIEQSPKKCVISNIETLQEKQWFCLHQHKGRDSDKLCGTLSISENTDIMSSNFKEPIDIHTYILIETIRE